MNSNSPFRPIEWVHPATHGFHLIAGPCSAESREQVMQVARHLHTLGVRHFRASLWKPRTRPGGFEGVGQAGIPWLREVHDQLGMCVMTEVATPHHIEAMLRAGLSTYWIGARTTSSPFAMTELAEALRGVDATILVKNPINPDLELWEGALLRLERVGIRQLGAIHRGFSTYGQSQYRNSPLWQIPIELRRRHPELTIISDPSHISGKRNLVEQLSRSAIELHFDGLIIETHPSPESALSDAAQQLTPDELALLLSRLRTPQADIDSPELDLLRAEIDELDTRLLHLLSQRMQVARRIGRYKDERGQCYLQPNRYRTMMAERYQLGETLGLDEQLIHELFSSIHEASIHTQQAQR